MLVVSGLLGNGIYQIYLHTQHAALLEQDFARGAGVGVFLGLELVGFVMLFKQKQTRTRGTQGCGSPVQPLDE